MRPRKFRVSDLTKKDVRQLKSRVDMLEPTGFVYPQADSSDGGGGTTITGLVLNSDGTITLQTSAGNFSTSAIVSGVPFNIPVATRHVTPPLMQERYSVVLANHGGAENHGGRVFK